MDPKFPMNPTPSQEKPEEIKRKLADLGQDLLQLSRGAVEDQWNKWRAIHLRGRERPSLQGAFFENAVIPGINLEGIDLTGAHFSGAIMRGARLDCATLDRSRFHNTFLTDATLRSASLRETDFNDAMLAVVNAEGADFTNANIVHSILRGASFANANLEDAKLTGSNIHGVKFYGARFSDKTILPSGVDFKTFIEEIVPFILTAGGAKLKDVVDPHHWYSSVERTLILAYDTRPEGAPLLPQRYIDPILCRPLAQ